MKINIFKDKELEINLPTFIVCKNCGVEIIGRNKTFCSRFCLGQFYGKKNKGKKYERHSEIKCMVKNGSS